MIDSIFDACVSWLLALAAALGTSYKTVNVWIFCFIWPLVTLGLIMTCYYVYLQSEHHKTCWRLLLARMRALAVPDSPPRLWLRLFHGRKSPDESMDDWGTDGPVFGPLDYVHTTYKCRVWLGARQPELHAQLLIIDDVIYYDGVYYGDWSASALNPCKFGEEPAKYDEEKATPPCLKTTKKS